MGSREGGSVEGGTDPEDLPSDFFDDFHKDEFMQGLSVIDSWDDDDTGKRRIDADAVDSVKDLRELIRSDGKEEDKPSKKGEGEPVKFDNKYKWHKDQKQGSGSDQRRSGSRSKLDEFIKPGSRRDPNKTNEAIKKDKEVKVKELLAKHLDDDLRPPGTELDDYYSEGKPAERKKTPATVEEPQRRHRSREHKRINKDSPPRQRRSPRYSPRRSPRREFQRRSPHRNFRHYSPQRKFQYRRYSPRRRTSPSRRSPRRNSPSRRSPLLSGPYRSRSPLSYRHYGNGSPSRGYPRDTFLYPNDPSGYPPRESSYSEGPYPGSIEYPEDPPGYPYSQGSSYPGGYGPPGYEYGVQQSAPLPVPAPAQVATSNPITPTVPAPLMSAQIGAPSMVPPPSQTISPSLNTSLSESSRQPYDALAQLVADGKLSQQDYLKLAPNKGVNNSLDAKTRVVVLKRCDSALSKLAMLLLPNRLTMHHSLISQEPKSLAPKYCSPLKRQAAIEFQFTKASGASMQQNKQLVDSIIATIGLDKVVSRPKKKVAKDMKDAAVQTTKPYCDVCEIREATRSFEKGTSIDPEHFCSSTHTQVLEQDLMKSKSIFNPTGSASDSAPMSIAHMTPAQLVSQLAARAKTLKQTSEPVPPPNNQWRNPPNYPPNRGHYNNYDNYNYRY